MTTDTHIRPEWRQALEHLPNGINADLFSRVADQIEREPRLWNQKWFVSKESCGTTYCIGGWAVMLEEGQIGARATGIFVRAQRAMGLTFHEANMLFFGGFDRGAKSAAGVLRRIAAGEDVETVLTEVDW